MAVSSVVAHKIRGPITSSLILFLSVLPSASAADRPIEVGKPIVFAASVIAPHAPGVDAASVAHLIA
jgi:hypothetical protein